MWMTGNYSLTFVGDQEIPECKRLSSNQVLRFFDERHDAIH